MTRDIRWISLGEGTLYGPATSAIARCRLRQRCRLAGVGVYVPTGERVEVALRLEGEAGTGAGRGVVVLAQSGELWRAGESAASLPDGRRVEGVQRYDALPWALCEGDVLAVRVRLESVEGAPTVSVLPMVAIERR